MPNPPHYSSQLYEKKTSHVTSSLHSVLVEPPVVCLSPKKKKKRQWFLNIFRRSWKCQDAHHYVSSVKPTSRPYRNCKDHTVTSEVKCSSPDSLTTCATTRTMEGTPTRTVPFKLELPIPIRRTLKSSLGPVVEASTNGCKRWPHDPTLAKIPLPMSDFHSKEKVTPSTTHVTMSDSSVGSLCPS